MTSLFVMTGLFNVCVNAKFANRPNSLFIIGESRGEFFLNVFMGLSAFKPEFRVGCLCWLSGSGLCLF